MKKLIALLLAAVMVLSLAACGGSSAPAASPEAPASDAEAPAASGKVDIASLSDVERAAAEGEIRNALAMMIDRNYIIENIAQGGQTPASSFVPMGMTDYVGGQFYENAGDHTDGYALYW